MHHVDRPSHREANDNRDKCSEKKHGLGLTHKYKPMLSHEVAS